MTALLKLGALGLVLSVLVTFAFSTQRSADAAIHEQIGAACNADFVGEIVPPGQVRNGQSFLRALQATGIIESIDDSVLGEVTINFDLSKPNSKYRDSGADLTIPNFFPNGDDLILSPLPEPDPDFPAHANCANPDLEE